MGGSFKAGGEIIWETVLGLRVRLLGWQSQGWSETIWVTNFKAGGESIWLAVLVLRLGARLFVWQS